MIVTTYLPKFKFSSKVNQTNPSIVSNQSNKRFIAFKEI